MEPLEQDAVPSEHKELLLKKSGQLHAAWTGPGQSDIIKHLLYTPLSGLLHSGKVRRDYGRRRELQS